MRPLDTIERWLFRLTIGLAAGLLWLAPRLPMVDLPQHAGQVALWRDLLMGVSAWTDLVHINLLTPYLIGYAAMLPLSLVVPIGIATKIVLTLAFLGFVTLGLMLRRSLQADPKLDWFLLWGFFGFAFHWGLLTFLVAAPLFFAFILVVRAQLRQPTFVRGLAVVTAGTLLLFSHGLVFLLGLLVGSMLALRHVLNNGWRGLPRVLLPYGVLSGLCVLFRLATLRLDGAMQFDHAVYGIPLWQRLSGVLIFVNAQDNADLRLFALTLVVLCVPWLLRCRLNSGDAWVIIAGLVCVLVAMPAYAAQTDLLFQRFSLFLLPCVSLMFRPSERGTKAGARLAAFGLLAVSTWLMLGIDAERIIGFRTESQPFETVLAAAHPGKRALALVYDRASPAAVNEDAYLHFASWYQAEKHGFVDFNFAIYHPQVVRFQPGRSPDLLQRKGAEPQLFLRLQDGQRYDYVFVRELQGGEAEELIRTSPCRYDIAAEERPWVLLERRTCPPDVSPR